MKFEKRKINALVRHATKIRRLKSGAKVVRWPAGFKERTVSAMIDGISAGVLKKALNIHFATLMAWRRDFKSESSGKTFRALKVVDGPKSKSQGKSPVKIFVTTPQGSEVHGLSYEDIASFIRRGVL